MKTETTERPAAGEPLGASVRAGGPETIIDIMLRALDEKARPDALNYTRGGEWRPISSEELLRRVRRVALGLHALGLRRGERAGILSESSPEWVVADLGCQFAGIVDVPLYPTLAPQQVCYIAEDSGARLLFIQHRDALASRRRNRGDPRPGWSWMVASA